MDWLPEQRARMVAKNEAEYGERYQLLAFPDTAALHQAKARRAELLDALAAEVRPGCGGTKLGMDDLSPGCRICTEGGWSCLFINGRCNCDCFYCPTSQDEIGLPTTNSVSFRHPADYVAYLERFGFSGASISGGEPLLTLGRSLGFISAIKRRFGAGMHVWLYTNGTLATETALGKLRDAGLDEIRFDIGATGYSLKMLQSAATFIPTVTVEIPAVPEETERLKELLPALRESGVRHLNLHQMRLTPYNFHRLQPRGYRYLHGEKVTVLDSELAALELMRHASQERLGLPVNYCSFPYKNRYQALAARRRNAAFFLKGHEGLTASGYIRSLTLLGNPARLTGLTERFRENLADESLWSLDSAGDRLTIHPSLWPLVDLDGLRLRLGYAEARQQSAVSYRNPFLTVPLSSRQKVIIEKGKSFADIELDTASSELYGETFLQGRRTVDQLPPVAPWPDLFALEQVRPGLQEYF